LAVTGEPTQEFSQHSYIRRHGRLTRAQARALDHHTIEYAISSDQLQTYAQECALGIEIGFGMGHALFDWACSAPD
jgi:tRNA G46 methylase TrmB